ncbi:MAG: SDR family oxidoreductase [Acidimicrobiia bacterium]|nr:SDR family oxidoreductase [Acidimicrobiia bacterium]
MTPPLFSLDGRVALVTGAGSPSGIGFASARLIGELGASVMITSTTDRIHARAAELSQMGIKARGSFGDLTRETYVEVLIKETVDSFGRLDIVVNNAGMTSVSDPDTDDGALASLSYELWRASLIRNLDTAFLVSRTALPHMVENRWGRIINVASITGPVMAMKDDAAYATSKAGMVGMTRSIAVDYAGHGITANAVAPGWIATGSQTENEAEQGKVTPIGRSATPDEVAAAVAWLATPGAAYTTGLCIAVDGGNSISEERV